MAFVNPNVLSRIFGREGMIASQSPEKQQRLVHMLAGLGSGMTQAAAQPGAGFAQALGGGAAGMTQGMQQAQQMQMQQMQMTQAQREMERQERISKIMGDILGGTGGQRPDFASQVNAQLPQTPQLAPAGPAQATPLQEPAGILSRRFEVGEGGVGTVSSGQGDPGGQSFGAHQLSSGAGTMASFLQSPEGQPFATQFGDLSPSDPRFAQVYQEVVQQAGPQMEQAQRQFIERTHVQPVMQAAQQAGLPVENPAIREALFSQSVQHSGEGNLQIINETMAKLKPGADPEDVIDALYDSRQQYALAALERNGAEPGVIAGVRSRYQQERRQAKEMAAAQQRMALPPPGQAPQNGYQQVQRGSGGQLNLPPQAAQLLSLMAPEKAASALWDLQTKQPADMPAEVKELMWAFDGDEDRARAAWHAQQQADADETVDQRDRKIRDYQQLYGVDRNMAVAMADGLMKPIYNEELGRTVLIDSRDPTNPQVREVEIAPASQPTAEERPEETMFDIAQKGNIAGIAPSVSETLGSVTGQFGVLSERQEEAAEQRQTFLLTNRSLIRALQDSPMYAQREREAIEREIGINPSAFDSQPQLVARMRAIHGVLNRRLAEADRLAGDPSQGDDIRRRAAKSASDIRSYLTQLGDPPQEGGGFSSEDQQLIDRWAN